MSVDIAKVVEELYAELKTNNGGAVADYIPQLERVNPDLFGISIYRLDNENLEGGEEINFGDTTEEFTIQSCSKPLSYCLARKLEMEENGIQVHKHVGYEPSGQAFNAFVLNRDNLPHNPLINAGAMVVSSLIKPHDDEDERFETIIDFYRELSGGIGKIGFDNSVSLSEKKSASRNYSLAYNMLDHKAFPEYVNNDNLKHYVSLYFQCCSIQINARIGAAIAATLANNGICPITNKKIIDDKIVKDTLSLMYGCGMYDYSGTFAFEVGLPAKSGVSGCIFLVIPQQMGICIWSPRLDKMGNSVRGVEFCKEFVKRTNYIYHIFHNITMGNNKVKITNECLISAAATGDLTTVKKLTSKLGPNVSDYDKRAPLHLAAAEGHVEIVKFLLEQGADPDIHDSKGSTPLNEAKWNLNRLITNETNKQDVEIIKRYRTIIKILSKKNENNMTL